MADGVARVLVDSAGNLVKVTQDGSDYKIEILGKLRDAGGTIVNPAKEDGNLATLAGKDFATQTTLASLLSAFNAEDFASETTLVSVDGRLTTIDAVLDSIKDVDGIKKIADQLPAGTNEIGKVAQGTKAAGAGAWPQVLYDAAGNVVGVVQDGSVYRLQTEAQLATGAKVQLTDGTNDASITADGKLNVTVATGATKAVFELLKNGSSSEMAVNAGGTPQEFEWNPGAEDVAGEGLAFLIEDATIYFGDKFGGISALSNGVLVEMKVSDVVCTLPVLYRTRDLFQIAAPGGFDLYAATPDSLRAQLGMANCVFKATGTYATDDYVRVTIRDNLSGLSHMSAMFKGRKV